MIVYRNKPNATIIGGTIFKPGNNEVSREQLERLLENRQFQHERKTGTMTILTASHPTGIPDEEKAEIQPEPEPKPAESLADFTANDAIKVVQDTYDIKLLDSWLESESRKTVKVAIKKQIEVIEVPAVEESEMSDEEKAELGEDE